LDTVIGQIVFYAACAYALGLLIFLPGVVLGLKRRTAPVSPEASVTVLVCARNEEEHINACLRSLTAIDYPRDRLEILIVDDRSTDATSDILQAWRSKVPNINVLSITSDVEGARGKVNALIQGMDQVNGEIILMTDADCIVPRDWVKEHLRWYDADTGMVSSMTSLKPYTIFSGAHCLEMVQVLALSMAGINYGIPVSVIGNNLSVRKAAYDELGGYRSIDFSVTEDLALFQAVWYSRKWKAKFKANRDIAVLTEPPDDFTTWWRQKHRWVAGGKAIGLPGWVILLLGFLGVLVMVIAPFVLDAGFALTALAMKFAIDLAILIPTFVSIGKPVRLLFFPFYQLYLFFFLMCVPVLYFQKSVRWKERVYRV
jgi:cellulose synthase/poly-beta-1,6-N-acetylglucosamine synthase-like glycosyltransferase